MTGRKLLGASEFIHVLRHGCVIGAVLAICAILALSHAGAEEIRSVTQTDASGRPVEIRYEVPGKTFGPAEESQQAPQKSLGVTLTPPKARAFTKDLAEPPPAIPPIDTDAMIEGFNIDEDQALNGLPDNEFHVPPDPNFAVGPDHVMGVVNSSIFWDEKDPADRDGANTRVEFSLTEFFAEVMPTATLPQIVTEPFNPRVIFDQHRNRFVVVAVVRIIDESDPASTFGDSVLLIARSNTADPNSLTENREEGFEFESIIPPLAFDFPAIAMDEQVIYITGNIFELGQLGTFQTSLVWVIEKEPFYFDPNGDFAVDSVTVFDPADASGTFATSTVPTHIFGKGPMTSTLYGADPATNELVVVDPMTGRARAVGPFEDDDGNPAGTVEHIEWSPDGCLLYIVTDAPELHTVDPRTGTTLRTVALTEPLVALEFAPDGRFLGATGAGELVEINPIDGTLTTIGPIGVSVVGMTFNEGFATLFGITDGSPPQLVQIDPDNGGFLAPSVTVNGISGSADGLEMGFDRDLLTTGTDGVLYSINPETGDATAIDPTMQGLGTTAELSGIAFRPNIGTWLVRYSGISDSFGDESLSTIRLDRPITKLYGFEDTVSGRLVTIDTVTAELTPIADPRLNDLTDSIVEIEWSPDGLTLFATTNATTNPTGQTIHTIDPINGEVLMSVPHDSFTQGETSPPSDPSELNGLAFAEDGKLFGALFIPNLNSVRLVIVDPITGELTAPPDDSDPNPRLIEDATGTELGQRVHGLVFTADGTLLGITDGTSSSDIISIDIPTGEFTVEAMDILPNGAFGRSLEFTADGRLVTIADDGGGQTLYELDVANGTSTPINGAITPAPAAPITGLSTRLPTFTHQFVSVGDIDDLSFSVPDAPQDNGAMGDEDPPLPPAPLLNTNDRRATNAVWRNDFLYTTATIVTPPPGSNSGAACALFGVTGDPNDLTVDENLLVRIDPDTGLATGITEVNVPDPITEIEWLLDGSRLLAVAGDTLFAVNPGDGAVLDQVMLSQPGEYHALEFDIDGNLFAVRTPPTGNPEIVTIDLDTGDVFQVVQLVNLGERIGGMAFNADFTEIIAITAGMDEMPPRLISIDPGDNTVTVLSTIDPPAGVADPSMFAADSLSFTCDGALVFGGNDGFLYQVLDLMTGDVARLPLLAGAGAKLPMGVDALAGLALRPNNLTDPLTTTPEATVHWWQVDTARKMFASDTTNGQLATVNPHTGFVSAVGPFDGAPGDIIELEWEPNGERLFGATGDDGTDTDTLSRSIVTINPESGRIFTSLLHDPDPNATPSEPAGDLHALEFDAFGRLLGSLHIPELVASDTRPNELVEVKFNTGGLDAITAPPSAVDTTNPPQSPIDTDNPMDPDGKTDFELDSSRFIRVTGLVFDKNFQRFWGVTQRGVDPNTDADAPPALIRISPFGEPVGDPPSMQNIAPGEVLEEDIFITNFLNLPAGTDLMTLEFLSLEFTTDGRLVTTGNDGFLYEILLGTAGDVANQVDVRTIGQLEIADDPGMVATSITGLSVSPLRLFDQGDVGGEDILDVTDIFDMDMEDPTFTAGNFTFFPSIMVDEGDNVALSFSASGPDIFPGAYYTARRPDDPRGVMRETGKLAIGQAPYFRTLFTFNEDKNRWGNYSDIVLDPSDGTSFWVFNAFASFAGSPVDGEDGRWDTRGAPFDLENFVPPVNFETDPDRDGLTNTQEAALGTDPNLADTDGDGISDGAEFFGLFGFVTNPALRDTDGDGLSDRDEISSEAGFATDPTNHDTDGDGVGDGSEVLRGTDPLDANDFLSFPADSVPFFEPAPS